MGLIFSLWGVADLPSFRNMHMIFTEQYYEKGIVLFFFYFIFFWAKTASQAIGSIYHVIICEPMGRKKIEEINKFIPHIYMQNILPWYTEKCFYIIYEHHWWNMGNVIALLFVSSYCQKINVLLKQIDHHLAAVTGRTDSETHICCAQYFCLLFFLLTVNETKYSLVFPIDVNFLFVGF